jgi:hypothetical protein
VKLHRRAHSELFALNRRGPLPKGTPPREKGQKHIPGWAVQARDEVLAHVAEKFEIDAADITRREGQFAVPRWCFWCALKAMFGDTVAGRLTDNGQATISVSAHRLRKRDPVLYAEAKRYGESVREQYETRRAA